MFQSCFSCLDLLPGPTNGRQLAPSSFIGFPFIVCFRVVSPV
jgi:hypothetical protein